MCMFFFSSRRRHTRWTGDWSSDVCSSDLRPFATDTPHGSVTGTLVALPGPPTPPATVEIVPAAAAAALAPPPAAPPTAISPVTTRAGPPRVSQPLPAMRSAPTPAPLPKVSPGSSRAAIRELPGFHDNDARAARSDDVNR